MLCQLPNIVRLSQTTLDEPYVRRKSDYKKITRHENKRLDTINILLQGR